MVDPKCTCGANDFKVATVGSRISSSKNKAKLVICSQCGLIYGAVNNIDIEALFRQQNEILVKLGKKLDSLMEKQPSPEDRT